MFATKLKNGGRFTVEFEIFREIEPGEIWHGVTVTNLRRNLFAARPVGREGPEILVCTDGWEEEESCRGSTD